jgi:hypothetical protein
MCSYPVTDPVTYCGWCLVLPCDPMACKVLNDAVQLLALVVSGSVHVVCVASVHVVGNLAKTLMRSITLLSIRSNHQQWFLWVW